MTDKFAERLKTLRAHKGLSASEMARLIGVPQTTYSDWENGKGLRIPPLLKISQVLAISVTELVIGQQTPADELIKEIELVEEKLRSIKVKLSTVTWTESPVITKF
jgi:transcriptional regulator with XRE-family HTH domain